MTKKQTATLYEATKILIYVTPLEALNKLNDIKRIVKGK